MRGSIRSTGIKRYRKYGRHVDRRPAGAGERVSLANCPVRWKEEERLIGAHACPNEREREGRGPRFTALPLYGAPVSVAVSPVQLVR